MYLCEALGYRVLVDDIRINDYSSTPLINFSWANRITEPHFGIGVNAIVSAKWFSEKLTKPSASVKIFQRNQNSQIENALQLNALACLQVVLEEKGLVQSGQELDVFVRNYVVGMPEPKTEEMVMGRISADKHNSANYVAIKIGRLEIRKFYPSYSDSISEPVAIWQTGFVQEYYAAYGYDDREFKRILQTIVCRRAEIAEACSFIGSISIAKIIDSTSDCLVSDYLSFNSFIGELVLGNADAALTVALSAPLYAKSFDNTRAGFVCSRVCWNRNSELNKEQGIVFPRWPVQLGIEVRADYRLNLDLNPNLGGVHEMSNISIAFLDEPRIIAKIGKISCG